MKKESIILPLFLLVMNATAQEAVIPTITKSDPLFQKNEISVNTQPVLKVLMNAGESEVNRFSATYKRNLNEKSALRFTLAADMINRDSNIPLAQSESIILATDSIVIKQHSSTPSYVSPHVNIGYERHFGKKKIQWFYGADLLLGYSVSNTIKQNTTLYRDTAQGDFVWVQKGFNSEIVSKTRRETISIGVVQFFGAKIPISKHLSVSAQVGCDMAYNNQHLSGTGVPMGRQSHISSFDFSGAAGFLNDVSLIYKF